MATSRSSSSERTGAGNMTMGSTFRRAHCLAGGQLTPPSSPDHIRQPAARHVPRLQLGKLMRRPKPSKSNTILTISRPTETRTLQIPACVSEMKLPLPLLYPESPVDTEYSCSSTVSPTSAPELRRVSQSYQDLRFAAAQQLSPHPPRIATPLLPSLITYDTNERHDSFFRFHNPRLTNAANDYKSYEDLHILSCYYDDSKTASLQEIEQQLEEGQEQMSEGSFVAEDGDYSSSTGTEEMPATPTDQVRRSTMCSDESDWLASTRSHSERLKRFKARCYQVVQHPMSSKKEENDGNQIMLATVLVGPGRPRLVQISRPSSKSSCSRNDSATRQRPRTPAAAPAEVSAFSPYDTPGPNRAYKNGSDINFSSSDPSYSTASLVPAPLTLTSRSHSITTTNTSSTAFSSTIPHINSLADPFAPCRSATSDYNPPARSSSLHPPSYNLQPHTSRTPSPHPSPTEITAHHFRIRRLERTLNAATQAINFFLDGILRLDSPAIQELRSPHIANSTYILALQKIFPSARELLLSALAAWILVDLYLTRIIAEAGRLPNMMLTRASSLNSWDQLTLLAARSNDSLHRIPTKARDVLGIGRPKATVDKANETALVKRAVVVSHSVAVIGQKLIEALRGTWDEDIWRALRCLVEVIEGCGMERAGWV